MMATPTTNTATPVATQENLVLVLTANHEDPDFWRYLEANFHVEVEYEANPTLHSGANQLFESPTKTTTAWGDSYRFDPIEICNTVHFDSDSDCTSTVSPRHPQKSYKVNKECAACKYVGGQEHCDWMNRATGVITIPCREDTFLDLTPRFSV
ncbi:hypothetical protein D8674_004282 [Pyrus ussuriensis x Pyrus communis]|uniref:Uncharacterized protein n=1 Tax=Pyrus ussuriensis x Pyrus communis TaxID=2448454 RepID=A0A5N5FK09_9ROSA|nr:hypothetical protein D8674_004282 [Pyrus ussuriensis x Pyrus communis]